MAPLRDPRARQPDPPQERGAQRALARLRHRLAEALDLPKDVVLDLPRVIAVGHLQVLVDNHRGLLEYSPVRVVIALASGRLAVTGEDLRIGTVSAEEVTVTGEIRAIEFLR